MQKLEDVREKVSVEAKELETKVIALEKFINNDKLFKEVSGVQRLLMRRQLVFMESYLDMLTARIKDLNNQIENK